MLPILLPMMANMETHGAVFLPEERIRIGISSVVVRQDAGSLSLGGTTQSIGVVLSTSSDMKTETAGP